MMTTTTKRQRKPRFRRVQDISIRLQERDVEIVRQVHSHRFLNSVHITALLGASRQMVSRRLEKLFHAGYLDRPKVQIEISHNVPMIYSLGNRGADLLHERFGVHRSEVDWTTKDREIKLGFLEHTLAISDFMVCLEAACKERSDVQLIQPGTILEQMPGEVKKQTRPWRWSVEYEKKTPAGIQKIKSGIEPDKTFGLYFPNEKEGRQRAYFFLELDRSTETIKPIKSNPRSPIDKKLMCYVSSWQQKLFEKTFPFKTARVLFVTRSATRCQNIIEVGKQLDPRGKGFRLFLFSPQKQFSLKEPGKILDKFWINGQSEAASLID